MKQFFKFTLATVVGIIITTLIGFFFLFGIIGIIASSSDKPTELKENSIYQLELNGEIVERSEENPLEDIFADILNQKSLKMGLDDILANIDKAKNNDNIVGIYLKIDATSAGYATIKEIRDALKDFKKSGKFIVAYADSYTQKMYYLASVADKIYINPEGLLDFKGMAFTTRFIKNTLQKVGVEMQIVKVGTFKSAVEPYIRTNMSEANRQQVKTFIGGIWNEIINSISEERGITPEQLNRYADEVMTFQPTEKYITYNMVDSLTYLSEMDSVLKKQTKVKKSEEYHLITHDNMTQVPADKKYKKEKIAVLYATGGIDMSSNSNEGINSEKLVQSILDLKKNKKVKAVVLRVNSPGGSAFGSEQIWHALMLLKKEKPLIVSMGNYAASGGYYISAPADTILAEPTTLTGSIGIFGTFPNIEKLNQKIGLTYDGVKTNQLSDSFTPNRAFSAEERNLLQGYVNRGYELFVKRCADGRGKTTDDIKAIAEGRVWTGKDALKIGLVDMLGGLDDAIQIAAQKAKIEEYNVQSFPKKDDFMNKLLKELETEAETRIIKSKLGNENYKVLEQIQNATKFNGIYTLMPYEISNF